MRSSWQTETGHLTCRWSVMEQRVENNLYWTQQIPEMRSGYLPPLPDFPSHSPFGGASWFQPLICDRDFEWKN